MSVVFSALFAYWRAANGLARRRVRVAGLRNWQLRQRPLCRSERSAAMAVGNADFHIDADYLSDYRVKIVCGCLTGGLFNSAS